MGIESAPQRAVNVPVGPLVTSAEAVVTPNAVSALSEAFRRGVITSEDIISRFGDLAKKKEKAELMSLDEAMSPESVAARKQGIAAQTATGALQEQTALAGVSNLAQQQEIERLGPIGKLGMEAFTKLGPEAGVFEVPALSDGRPDYATMASIGLQLASQKVKQSEAQNRLKGGKRITSADGTVSMFQDAYGEILPQRDFEELDKIAKSPLNFSSMKPGSVQVAPAEPQQPVVIPRRPVQMPLRPATTGYEARGQLQAAQIMDEPMLSQISDEEALRRAQIAFSQPVVEPSAAATDQQSAPVIAPAGQPTAAGISLGAPASELKPQTGLQLAQDITILESLGNDIKEARQIIAGQNVVGPAIGNVGVRTATQVGAVLGVGDEERRRVGQRKLEILRSQKVLEGAQKMKGNLSDKDVRFLQDTIPQLADDEVIWNDYLNKWERMNEANKQILRGELPRGYSVLDEISRAQSSAQPTAAAQPAGAAGAVGPVITLSSGKKVRKDANGQYQLVP